MDTFLRIRSAVLKWRCNFMKYLSGKFFTTHIKVQMQNDINSFNKNNIVHMFENSPQLK